MAKTATIRRLKEEPKDAEPGYISMTLPIRFRKGYIAHPYWPAREKVINIEKESGTRRARSEANRAKSLTDYLRKIGMSEVEYEALRRQADRQFYVVSDVLQRGDTASGKDMDEIVIPQHQVYGAFAQASNTARSATRIASADNIRTVLELLEPIYTGHHERDGVFERFAVPTAGTGAKLSNQRALRTNDFLGPFSAEMTVQFDPHLVAPDRVRNFLEFVGRDVGVGACRKMGWGRFEIAAVER